jgi:hypothetical protein
MRIALILIMALLQVADFLTSRAAFARGAVELNPLLGFGTRPGPELIVAKLASIILFWLFVKRTRNLWIAGALCAVFAAIVCWNAVL